VRSYTYDHANRLTSVTSGTLTTGFTYNGAGDRVARTVDGVTTDYVLDPAAGLTQVLQETSDGQTTSYLYGADLLAQYDSGTWAYHLNDGLGSVRQLADPAGQVVQGYSFSPFGVPLGESGGEPYGYTGEQWDASAGLVFLRARYMQPETGRFTQRDPWPADMFQPQTFNGWPYVTNNPANRVDPSGYFSNDEIARSLGMSDFDDVIQVFTGDKDLPPYAGGKWGLLRLLQEAKSNDTLSGLIVSEFGIESRVSIGQFHCKNGTIRVGCDMDVRELLSYLHTLERGTTPPGGDVIIWRSLLQGYYLNGRAFCDGYKTDLPDFAMFSLGFDVWAPDLFGGSRGRVQGDLHR
jgi:RHS repeat-associated protein